MVVLLRVVVSMLQVLLTLLGGVTARGTDASMRNVLGTCAVGDWYVNFGFLRIADANVAAETLLAFVVVGGCIPADRSSLRWFIVIRISIPSS